MCDLCAYSCSFVDLCDVFCCRIGPRFPPMSDAYSKKYRDIAKQTAQELGYSEFVREGVYSFLTGPTFETVTECRLLRMIGSDATGQTRF